jgi:hypothetical protein
MNIVMIIAIAKHHKKINFMVGNNITMKKETKNRAIINNITIKKKDQASEQHTMKFFV